MSDLTERQRIEREIARVGEMWASPYRKGIIAGLRQRLGHKAGECPYTTPRASRNWRTGVESGLKRDCWWIGLDGPRPDSKGSGG